VILAAGALGTNRLLATCRDAGSLPRLSDRLGHRVRTNSESIVAVTAPDDKRDFGASVAISSSIYPDPETHVELVTYGAGGDAMSTLYTTLVGDGTRVTRPLRWLVAVAVHPLRFARSLWPVAWSRRTLIVLVMQTTDAAIRFRPVPKRFGSGIRLTTEQDADNPNPTYIPVANQAAKWFAERLGGTPQSGVTEALLNIPITAHILGGAVVGTDASTGVVDRDGRVFGYDNMLVTDGSALPANPGVNPSLTITALAERTLAQVPPRDSEARPARRPVARRHRAAAS
jgi:cholesterol oxidase